MISQTSLTAPRLVAPGGPVTVALAVMAQPDDTFLAPQFPASGLDVTALAIAAGCIACWLSPFALFFGGLL